MIREVQLGDRTVRLEPFSGRKGVQVLRAVDHIAKGVPEIQTKWAEYTRQYEANHTIDLDRAFARSEFGPQPLFKETPIIEDGKALTDGQGRPLVRREPIRNDDGSVAMGPDPLGHLSEQDWAASNNLLRRPRSPSTEEQVVAVLPDILDLAEDELAKLLGLIAMPNADVKRYAREGALWDKAAELGDDLLDAELNQLVELAVAAGESLREEYQVKIRERLGERLGAALRLLGIEINGPEAGSKGSSDQPSTRSPESSIGSPEPTDGVNPEPSTAPAGDASSTSVTS